MLHQTSKDRKRFLTHVKKTPYCWIWNGSKRSGYGAFRYQGRLIAAHRVSYQLWVGSLTEADVVHHKCANRACVRPAHLQRLTSLENTAEMLERNGYIRAIKRLELELEKIKKELGRDSL